MPVGTRRRPGDPLTGTIQQRGLAIQTGGHFHSQPGPPPPHARHKTDIELFRLRSQQAAGHVHAGRLQPCQTTTGNLRIGIRHGRDHPRHSGCDQRLGTGRRAPVMAAGLQRNIDSCTARGGACPAQGMDLGMRLTGPLMPALANHLPLLRNDTAHPGIRRCCPQATLCQLQRPRHHGVIKRRKAHFLRAAGDTSLIAREKASTSSKFRYTEANRM